MIVFYTCTWPLGYGNGSIVVAHVDYLDLLSLSKASLDQARRNYRGTSPTHPHAPDPREIASRRQKVGGIYLNRAEQRPMTSP